MATPRKDATTPIVVLGDSMADWLAYGLEDAYSEKPDIGIVRKHRTDAGLIRYDPRREVEWPAVIREMIGADKPKFIVMMVGNNDRVAIREKQPPQVRPGTPAAPKGTAPQAQQPAQPAAPAAKPEPQDAELQQDNAEAVPVPTTEQGRQALYGPWEFHTEKWELAYIKRIDSAIAAMKSAGVPVIWVGLPSRNGAKATTDVAYLNELYKSRAEKAGIIFVDVWDGFVDEQGRYNAQGPDYEGQTRRLRTGDGVHFTKFGARKLAHYVEREIERSIVSRAVPVALPPIDQGPQPGTPAVAAKPGAVVPAQRPSAGPVLPLTTTATAPEELLGGGRAPAAARPAADPVAIPRSDERRAGQQCADRQGRRFRLAARQRGRRARDHPARDRDDAGRLDQARRTAECDCGRDAGRQEDRRGGRSQARRGAATSDHQSRGIARRRRLVRRLGRRWRQSQRRLGRLGQLGPLIGCAIGHRSGQSSPAYGFGSGACARSGCGRPKSGAAESWPI